MQLLAIKRILKRNNSWPALNRRLRFNSLPNDKILNWSKLKAFADVKIYVTEELKFVLGRIDKIVGKGENAGYQHFLLFPQCRQNASCFKMRNGLTLYSIYTHFNTMEKKAL